NDGVRDIVAGNFGSSDISVLLGKASDPAASLRLSALTMVDNACIGGQNGNFDPGETGSFTFTLQNYVSNPHDSPVTSTGVHATLSTSTPGANVIVAQQPFASIAPLASVANAVPFKIALDPGFVPGTDVDLLLTVDTDHGQALLRRRIATGSPGTTVA